jgi:hypothetical protein
MSHKLVFTILLVALLSQFSAFPVFATGEPSGSCAPGFTPVMVMEHDDHYHQHVGADTDQNGDGWICMMPVTPTEKVHVHVDNNLP